MTVTLNLSVGEWVEVRSKGEILNTLDSNGQLDGLPFMPEMFAYCGQRFPVHKRAHKTCDTVFPIRGRKMDATVHLTTRCNGSAHGGCQAECLLFWKEAWLKRVDSPDKCRTGGTPCEIDEQVNAVNEKAVWDGVCKRETVASGDPVYICQNTQIPYATTELKWWDLRQYIEDYTSGNVGLWRMLKGATYGSYFAISQAGIGAGSIMRWLYNALVPRFGGTLWPRMNGRIPQGQATPTEVINLQPGEWVRIKSHEEIIKTLNTDSKNRGMYWDAEMVPYCGKKFRVLKRVTQIIDEKTGKMIPMKNPCIMLESVVCESRYSFCRMFCPRAFPSYWREIWLERISADEMPPGESNRPASMARACNGILSEK